MSLNTPAKRENMLYSGADVVLSRLRIRTRPDRQRSDVDTTMAQVWCMFVQVASKVNLRLVLRVLLGKLVPVGIQHDLYEKPLYGDLNKTGVQHNNRTRQPLSLWLSSPRYQRPYLAVLRMGIKSHVTLKHCVTHFSIYPNSIVAFTDRRHNSVAIMARNIAITAGIYGLVPQSVIHDCTHMGEAHRKMVASRMPGHRFSSRSSSRFATSSLRCSYSSGLSPCRRRGRSWIGVGVVIQQRQSKEAEAGIQRQQPKAGASRAVGDGWKLNLPWLHPVWRERMHDVRAGRA